MLEHNGIELLRSKNKEFRTWNITEIYIEEDAGHPGRWVPNVDDMVVDWDVGLFRVVFVNELTGKSTLQPWDAAEMNGVDDLDILIGVAGGSVNESYRVYIDNSVTPSTLALDSRLHVYGSAAAHIKLFKGADISDNGTVISVQINTSGDVVSDNIPLTLVGSKLSNNTTLPPGTNVAIKAPVVSNTTHDISDGELIVAVVYDDVGMVTGITRLLAINTAFVREANAAVKHVTGISIKSPFLSTTLTDTLQYPLNLPLTSMLIKGVVHYNDGDTREVTIDGNEMSLFGLDSYVPTIVNQKVPLVLSYNLSVGESTFAGNSAAGIITKSYEARTLSAETAYNLKVYVAPRWIDDVTGYELKYYMYNVDRDTVVDVTEHIELDVTNGWIFNPIKYGTSQRIAIVLNLQDVDSKYIEHRHVQTFTIHLIGPAHAYESPWVIDYNNDGEVDYGNNIYALMTESDEDGFWDVKICAETNDVSEWLLRTFSATDPLVNSVIEGVPPTPTHFKVVIDEDEFYQPIENWAQAMKIDFVPKIDCTVEVFWIHENQTSNLQLAMGSLNVVISSSAADVYGVDQLQP